MNERTKKIKINVYIYIKLKQFVNFNLFRYFLFVVNLHTVTDFGLCCCCFLSTLFFIHELFSKEKNFVSDLIVLCLNVKKLWFSFQM